MVVFHLFYEDEPRVVVEIMIRLIEMLVKRESCGTCHIESMRIEAEVGWGFRFPHILIMGAFEAVA